MIFKLAYHRADSLVRTEIAHVQTEAARQRYLDYGIDEVEILVSPDERTCPICGKLDGQRYPASGRMPVPAHPNCRCCIVPVIEKDKVEENTIKIEQQKEVKQDKSTSTNLNSKQKLTNNTISDSIGITEEMLNEAQAVVEKIKQKELLHVYNKSERHLKHAKQITGIIDNDEKAWIEYEKAATDFFKLDIDGNNIIGFISDKKNLIKVKIDENLYGIYDSRGTISTYYIVDEEPIIGYFKKFFKAYRKKV